MVVATVACMALLMVGAVLRMPRVPRLPFKVTVLDVIFTASVLVMVLQLLPR